MDYSLGDILTILDMFSKALSKKDRFMGWLRQFFGGPSGPKIADVFALPVAVTAKDGKFYVRLYLLGARRKFGKGRIEAVPRIETAFFPSLSNGMQAHAGEVENFEDRFPTIDDADPFYRIVMNMPGAAGAEICKRVWDQPNSMGVLVHGYIEVDRKGKKFEIPIVPLNLSLGSGILNEHQGPLVRPKESP